MTFFIRRILPFVALAAILGFVLRAQGVPVAEADTYFHLRLGHEFLGPWSIRHPGHLGTYDSADWIPTQWLSQIAMAALEDRFDLLGVLGAYGWMLIALVVVTYLTCRAWSAPLAAALATALAYIAMAPGLSARPQVISYVLVAVFTWAWLETGRDGRARYWLIPLTWLWVPLHGMWIVGLLIGTVATTGLAIERTIGRQKLLRIAMVPAASAVLVVVTPIGIDAYRALFAVSSRSEYFSEWASPDLRTASGAAMLLMLALVVLTAIRKEALPIHQLCLVALAAAWGVYSERTIAVAGLMAAPLAAHALQSWTPGDLRRSRSELIVLATMCVGAAVAVPAVLNARIDDSVVPNWVDERLDALPAQSRVLNGWGEGAYLLWRHPDKDFVMHGYGDVFTDAEIERNADVMRLQPGWDEDLQALDVDVAVLRSDSVPAYTLRDVLCWPVVEADSDYTMFTGAPSADTSVNRCSVQAD